MAKTMEEIMEMARKANAAREAADAALAAKSRPRRVSHDGICPRCHTRCYGDCTASTY